MAENNKGRRSRIRVRDANGREGSVYYTSYISSPYRFAKTYPGSQILVTGNDGKQRWVNAGKDEVEGRIGNQHRLNFLEDAAAAPKKTTQAANNVPAAKPQGTVAAQPKTTATPTTKPTAAAPKTTAAAPKQTAPGNLFGGLGDAMMNKGREILGQVSKGVNEAEKQGKLKPQAKAQRGEREDARGRKRTQEEVNTGANAGVNTAVTAPAARTNWMGEIGWDNAREKYERGRTEERLDAAAKTGVVPWKEEGLRRAEDVLTGVPGANLGRDAKREIEGDYKPVQGGGDAEMSEAARRVIDADLEADRGEGRRPSEQAQQMAMNVVNAEAKEYKKRDDASKIVRGMNLSGVVDDVMKEGKRRSTDMTKGSGAKVALSGAGNPMGALIAGARESFGEVSPEQLQADLEKKLTENIEGYLTSKKGEITAAAEKLGMDIEDYFQEYVAPQIMEQASGILHDKQVEALIPKTRADAMLNAITNNVTGSMLKLAVTTKGQRELAGEAQSRNAQGEGYQMGPWESGTSMALSLLSDPIPLKGGGVIGEKVAAASVGRLAAAKGAARMANGTVGQRLFVGVGQSALAGGINLGFYDGFSSVLGAAASGEEMNLGDAGSNFITGFGHGAVTGATLGVTARLWGNATMRIGRTNVGWRTAFSNAAKRAAVGLGGKVVETGGFVLADAITNWETPTMTSTLDAAATVIALGLINGKTPMKVWEGVRHPVRSLLSLENPTPEMRLALDDDVRKELAGEDNKLSFQRIDEALKLMLQKKEAQDSNTWNEYGSELKKAWDDVVGRLSWDAQNQLGRYLFGVQAVERPRMFGVRREGNTVYEVDMIGNVLSVFKSDDVAERATWIWNKEAMQERDDMTRAWRDAQAKLWKDLLDMDPASDEFAGLVDDFLNENEGVKYDKMAAMDMNEVARELNDENSELGRDFRQWLLGTRGLMNDETIRDLGLSETEIVRLMSADVNRMDNEDRNNMQAIRERCEEIIFGKGEHVAWSKEKGADAGKASVDAVEAGGASAEPIPTEKMYVDAHEESKRKLSEYLATDGEVSQVLDGILFANNDADARGNLDLWMDAYQSLRSSGYTEERLAPIVEYMNSRGMLEGFRQGREMAIDEKVSNWGERVKYTGGDEEIEEVHVCVDGDGKTWYIKGGNYTVSPDGSVRPDEVGVVLVNENGEVKVNADGVKLVGKYSLEDAKDKYRKGLEEGVAAAEPQPAENQAEGGVEIPIEKKETTPSKEETPTVEEEKDESKEETPAVDNQPEGKDGENLPKEEGGETPPIETQTTDNPPVDNPPLSYDKEAYNEAMGLLKDKATRKVFFGFYPYGSSDPKEKEGWHRALKDYVIGLDKEAKDELLELGKQIGSQYLYPLFELIETTWRDHNRNVDNPPIDNPPIDNPPVEEGLKVGSRVKSKDGTIWQVMQPENGKSTLAPLDARGVPDVYKRVTEEEWNERESKIGQQTERQARFANERIKGGKDKLVTPTGQQVAGHYYLAEAETLTPSHDPFKGFSQTEGFPTKDGKTINDRVEYEDPIVQNDTRKKAQNYDQRAISDMVVAWDDGSIMSGNDRTMAGQLAAKNGTDGVYLDYLKEQAARFGFTTEQVASMQHPRVVFVPDEAMPRTTETMAMWNKPREKQQGWKQAAIKASKILRERNDIQRQISEIMYGVDNLSELYRSAERVNKLLQTLMEADMLTSEMRSEWVGEDGMLSDIGKERFETILLGSVFGEDTIKLLSDPNAKIGDVRKNVAYAIVPLIKNGRMKGYSILTELERAIDLICKAKAEGTDLAHYMLQMDLFGDRLATTSLASLMLADLVQSGPRKFKGTMEDLNGLFEKGATGQTDLYYQDMSRDGLLRDVLRDKKYDVDKIIKTYERRQGANTAAETGGDLPSVEKGNGEGEARGSTEGGNGGVKPHQELSADPLETAGRIASEDKAAERGALDAAKKKARAMVRVLARKIRRAGMEVVTDWREAQRVLAEAGYGEQGGESPEDGIKFSIRKKPAPKKTGVGYKVFVLKDGKLYPPMVANPGGAETPIGVWLDADEAPMAGMSKTGRPQVKAGGKGTQGGSGKLAYRPGWHLGEIPYALQFGRVNPETGARELFPNNFVWAEVEYSADKNYQQEADAEGVNANGKYQHSLAGMKRVPEDGAYRYRTNPDPNTDPWIITGAMKVNRLLTRAEVNEIVRKAGREPQKVQDGDIVTDDAVRAINKEIGKATAEPSRTVAGEKSEPKFQKAEQDDAARREETEKIFSTAKKRFGVTKDIREAGYVLPDGTMLDFSGRHELFGADDSGIRGRRATDHRVISSVAYAYDAEGKEYETGVNTSMPDFIERGAIRIDANAGTINLNVKPTSAQKRVLQRLIQHNGGDVIVDYGNGWDSQHYSEYERARQGRVLSDIDRYFDEGIKSSGNIKFFRTKNGEVYGFAYKGKVYLDERIAGTDTPIHEYTHLWSEALKQRDKGAWEKVVDLMKKQTELWDDVKKTYHWLDNDEDIADEVLAHYSGQKGKERLDAMMEKVDKGDAAGYAQVIATIDGVKRVLNNFWRKVANMLGMRWTSAERVADAVMGDLMKEENLGEDKRGQERTREDARMQEVERKGVFYSNAAKAVHDIKQSKATGAQWLAMVQKNGGLKAAEDKWLGLSDWLNERKGEKISKEDVLQFIRENRVQVQEANYSEIIDIDNNPRMKELREEFNKLAYEAAQKRGKGVLDVLTNFEDKMYEAHGDGWYDKMTPEEQEEYARLSEAFNQDTNTFETAFRQMVDKYGNDFDMSFESRNGRLEPTTDYGWDISEGAKHFLGIEDNDINETRLAYTTMGLDNKKEIALTVPSIEPWNEDDEIHFGDAGGGRAVAWVRFGDTIDKDGNLVLVIDEIQSNRHQEGREKGYYSPSAKKELQEYREQLKKKYPQGYLNPSTTDEMIKANERLWGNASKLTNEEQAKLSDLMEKAGVYTGEKVPDAPFDKNWHELAMKRMLRYAAEYGYDKIAWTKGEQQADRYSIGHVVYQITATPYKAQSPTESNGHDLLVNMRDGTRYEMFVQPDGTLNSGTELFNGKNVAEVFGKELGAKIMGAQEETVIKDDQIRVGGEGMKGFYDQMLPRFMDKYGKKWGVKTGEVELPEVEKAGRKMWSVDVTPEMRESVMKGQPMFQLAKGKEGAATAEPSLTEKPASEGVMMREGERREERSEVSRRAWEEMAFRRERLDREIKDVNKRIVGMQRGSEEWNRLFDERARLMGERKAVEQELASVTPRQTAAERKQSEEFAQRQWRRAHERGEELVKKLGLGDTVTMVDSIDELDGAERFSERQRNAKGWYDPETGKIVVVMGNHSNPDDVVKTILREGVAHHGLRKLFGEKFDTFLDNVYNESETDIAEEINSLASQKGYDTRRATEEYLARLAEDTEFERVNVSWWEKVKNWFVDMFKDLGGSDAYWGTMTDNELRYVLWRSYKNLEEPGARKNVFAEEQAMQEKLQVGDFEVRNEEDAIGLQRTGEEEAARYDIEQRQYSPAIRQNVTMSNANNLSFDDKVVVLNAWRDVKNKRSDAIAIIKTKIGYLIINSDRRMLADALGLEQKPYMVIAEKDLDLVLPLLVRAGHSVGIADVTKDTSREGEGVEFYDGGETALNSGRKSEDVAERVSDGRKTTAGEDMSKDERKMMFQVAMPGGGPRNPYTPLSEDAKRSRYEGAFKRANYWWHEAYVDGLKAVEEIMKAMTGKKSVSEILDAHNVYWKLQHLSSVVHERQEKMQRDHVEPLQKSLDDAIRRVAAHFSGKRKKVLSAEEKHEAFEEVKSLLWMKSGMERNRVLYVRDLKGVKIPDDPTKLPQYAQALYQTLHAATDWTKYPTPTEKAAKEAELRKQAFDGYYDDMYERWKAERTRLLGEYESGAIGLRDYYKGMDDFIKQEASECHKRYEADKKGSDYSGLNQVDGGFTNGKWNINAVLDNIELMEAVIGKPTVDAIWNEIRAISKETLEAEYKSSLVSRSQHKHVSEMMDWYLPMRKWNEDMAEDHYSYITGGRGKEPLRLVRANGRWSMPDDPLAWLLQQADAGILYGESNNAKLAFLRLAESTGDFGRGDLVSRSKVWEVLDGHDLNGDPIWRTVWPETTGDMSADKVANVVEQFNADMKAKEEAGEARISRRPLSLDWRNEKQRHKNEHMVQVMLNGQPTLLYVNGNPRAAQAINGLLQARATSTFTQRWGSMNRFISASYTSWSPKFVLRNTFRDRNFASWNVYAKEGAGYYGRFTKNWLSTLPLVHGLNSLRKTKHFSSGSMRSLWKAYENGTLDMNDKKHRYFSEWRENGGITGYVSDQAIDRYKETLDQALTMGDKRQAAAKAWKAVFGTLSAFNQYAENMARFAAYMTSRDMGRSILRSVADAKDASTNFNRKGAGGSTSIDAKSKSQSWAGTTAEFMRHAYIFMNPSIQSLSILKHRFKEHPARAALGMFTHFALSAAWPVFAGWLAQELHEKLGGDPNDPECDYGNIPEWDRRSGICLYAGKGVWVKLPLGIEQSAAWGMGQIFGSWFLPGQEDMKSATPPVMDVMSTLTALSPIDLLQNDGKSLLVAVAPTLTQPAVQMMTNMKWTGAPIEKDAKWANTAAPRWTRAFSSTPKFYVDVCKMLTWLTNGGNNVEAEKGLIDVSPGMMQTALKGYFGGPVDFLGDVGSVMLKDLSPKTIPVLNGILTQTGLEQKGLKTNAQYYKAKKKIDEVEYKLKVYSKDNADPSDTSRKIALENDWSSIIEDWETDEKEIKRLDKIAKDPSSDYEAEMARAEAFELKAKAAKRVLEK